MIRFDFILPQCNVIAVRFIADFLRFFDIALLCRFHFFYMDMREHVPSFFKYVAFPFRNRTFKKKKKKHFPNVFVGHVVYFVAKILFAFLQQCWVLIFSFWKKIETFSVLMDVPLSFPKTISNIVSSLRNVVHVHHQDGFNCA